MRRWTTIAGTVIALLVAPPALAASTQHRRVTVSATSDQWTRTGLVLRDGEHLTATVTGDGRCGAGCHPGYASGEFITCAKRREGALPPGPGGADIAGGALIARFGDGGKPFVLGYGGTFGGVGELEVVYNDCKDYYGDNTGSYTAAITFHPGVFQPVGRASTIATSLPRPSDALGSVGSDVVGVAIAGAAVLLITFPASLFNATFEENYDEIMGFARRLRRRRPQEEEREPRDLVHSRRGFVGVLLVGALLGCLNDPHFGGGASSITTYVGVLLSSLTGMALSLLVAGTFHRLRHAERAPLQLTSLPGGLAIAAACVVVSRLTGFEPGYLYGVVVGVGFARALSASEKGQLETASTAFGLGLALIAWWAAGPIDTAASHHGSFVGLVLLADVVGSLFVGVIVGTVIGLVPLRFLPGSGLRDWRRDVWAVLMLVSTFLLVQVLLRGQASGGHAPLVLTIVLFVVFAVGSVAFHDWFARRALLRSGAEVPPLLQRLQGLVRRAA